MTEQRNEYETRLLRLQQLKAAGIVPYANKYEKQYMIQDLLQRGKTGKIADGSVLLEQGASQIYSTAGRMMSFRTMGKLSFAHLRDSTGDIQIAFVKNLCRLHTGHEVVVEMTIADQVLTAYKFAEKYLDIGDFIGVKGDLFVTKHGELTLFVDEFQLLSKALRPLGDKRHGVKDEEKIYRQRYLDMTMNEASYQRFLFKTQFYDALRSFYKEQGFQEIVTSILGNAASGAAAKPFVTHHHDYDLDVFLRIAFEPALKMATVGRYEKVFEIGKDFRNEGSDPSHVQEFTQVEHYAAWRNYEDNMHFAEAMFAYLFKKLDLPAVIPVKNKDGKTVDVDRSTPWQKIDYIEGVKQASGGLDITRYANTDEDQAILVKDIQALGYHRDGMEEQGVTTLIDYLYKKILRPTIVGPAFVYNYPRTMQPLARQSDTNPSIVEQFQVVVNGWEIIKAYSELVDPTIQQANFDEQALALAKGDEEATSGDDEFLLAMEHGMPPQSGFGMGIERILALLTQQDNLRDVIMFPLMKPVQAQTHTASHDTDIPVDMKQELYTSMPTKDQAHELVATYLTDTRRHCEQVAQIMQWFARKLGQDEHARYVAGLLHDIDRDHIAKDPQKHLGEEFDMIMDAIQASDVLRNSIRSHYPAGTDVHPNSLLEKYLISVDELSGFLYAYSLMRPTGFVGMHIQGVKKRIKDISFAAGVDRGHIRHCETYLNIPLDEFLIDMIAACQELEF